ncbi:MAG: saccharopine dehydrogenase NADP-binding domain-containing protein [Polyangiales bacterium]
MPRPLIALYGATGFTGRLVAHAMAARGLALRLVGRDRARLDALAAELPGGASVAVAAYDDAQALRAAFREARVVVSCAGPFARYGRHVVDAALAEGRHYLDISGELAFAQTLIDRDAQARAQGVAIVGCVGFDVAVSDAAAVLACEALGTRTVADVRLTVASTTRPSRGSLRTLLDGLASDAYAWTFTDGRLAPMPVAAARWTVTLPPPFGRGAAASMGLVEAVVCPRSTGAARVRTGLALPSPGAFATVVRALRWACRQPVLGGLVRRALDAVTRLVPEGGSARVRRDARLAIEAQATDDAGAVRAVVVTGGDVGDVTAAAAAICAEAMLARADDAPVGHQTPAQAFGARWLLEQLAPHGVAWTATDPDPTPAAPNEPGTPRGVSPSPRPR